MGRLCNLNDTDTYDDVACWLHTGVQQCLAHALTPVQPALMEPYYSIHASFISTTYVYLVVKGMGKRGSLQKEYMVGCWASFESPRARDGALTG